MIHTMRRLPAVMRYMIHTRRFLAVMRRFREEVRPWRIPVVMRYRKEKRLIVHTRRTPAVMWKLPQKTTLLKVWNKMIRQRNQTLRRNKKRLYEP